MPVTDARTEKHLSLVTFSFGVSNRARKKIRIDAVRCSASAALRAIGWRSTDTQLLQRIVQSIRWPHGVVPDLSQHLFLTTRSGEFIRLTCPTAGRHMETRMPVGVWIEEGARLLLYLCERFANAESQSRA